MPALPGLPRSAQWLDEFGKPAGSTQLVDIIDYGVYLASVGKADDILVSADQVRAAKARSTWKAE